jgi:hypothetical protein
VNERVVKTRKEHICFGCSVRIPVGTDSLLREGIVGGQPQSEYYCEKCTPVFDAFLLSVGSEPWHQGDVGEWRLEGGE